MGRGRNPGGTRPEIRGVEASEGVREKMGRALGVSAAVGDASSRCMGVSYVIPITRVRQESRGAARELPHLLRPVRGSWQPGLGNGVGYRDGRWEPVGSPRSPCLRKESNGSHELGHVPYAGTTTVEVASLEIPRVRVGPQARSRSDPGDPNHRLGRRPAGSTPSAYEMNVGPQRSPAATLAGTPVSPRAREEAWGPAPSRCLT